MRCRQRIIYGTATLVAIVVVIIALSRFPKEAVSLNPFVSSVQRHGITTLKICFSSAKHLNNISKVILSTPGKREPIQLSTDDFCAVDGVRDRYCSKELYQLPLRNGVYILEVRYKNDEQVLESVLWHFRKIAPPASIEYFGSHIKWPRAEKAVSYIFEFYDAQHRLIHTSPVLMAMQGLDYGIYCVPASLCVEGKRNFIQIKAFDAVNVSHELLESYFVSNAAYSKELSMSYKASSSRIVLWKVKRIISEDVLEGAKQTSVFDVLLTFPETVSSVMVEYPGGRKHRLFFSSFISGFRANHMHELPLGKYVFTVRFKDREEELKQEFLIQENTIPVPSDIRYLPKEREITWNCDFTFSGYGVHLYREDKYGRLHLEAIIPAKTENAVLDGLGLVPGQSYCTQIYNYHNIVSGRGIIQNVGLSRKFYFTYI